MLHDVRGERGLTRPPRRCFPDSVGIGRRISDACDARGLLVRPIGRLNVLSPPLILTTEQIDWLVDTLRAGIEEVMAGLEFEGLWSNPG